MPSNKQKFKEMRRTFRESVLKRDGNCCVFCGEKYNLEVHHITDRKEMKNDGYSTLNGITLCSIHHLMAEKYHISKGREWEIGFHPNDLYQIIGTTFEEAKEDCEKL